MASICHNIANAVVRSKCWVIRENFMTAVSTSIIKDGSHVGDQCDDYEFWFNNNPSKPPTDAERQTICSNGQPDMNAMIQYLSTDYPQFSGVSLNESSQLPGVSNIRINKRCPAYYEPYLRLEWDFDPARWSSLTFNDIYFMNPQYPIYIDAAKAQYNRVKIYMSRAPGPGSTSADLWNLLIGLTFGGVFEVPYNTNQAADRILPYYFTRHTSSTLVNHFRDYAPDYDFLYWDYWMNPLPDQIDPWPNGNYQFNVQTSIIGYPNNDPARVPFEIQSEPVSKSYCNHEVLNWCVEPWGSDGRCDSNNMPK